MSILPSQAYSADRPVGSASSSLGVNANPNSAGSLQNEFISLMVAQIQNQDPLNPLDGTEYVSQLAQFSQVQSTENMTTMTKNSMVLLDNLQVLSTANLVGKTVYVPSHEFELGSEVQKGKVELAHASSQVTLEIKDRFGKTTKVPLGAHAKGEVDFEIDPDKLGLSAGEYSLSVKVQEGQAKPNILLAGQVENVRIPSTGGVAQVSIAGLGNVPFVEISQFGS